MVTELAYHKTPLGELTLRRRTELRLDNAEVYEVKLGDEFLMSSLFTEGEMQLAHFGLADVAGEASVVVGGLGLGYTAAAVLEHENVSSLLVIELLPEVIDWHLNGLVPLGNVLTRDGRCELKQGDFFALAASGFDQADASRRFDAILLDIDHTPDHYLNDDNGSFYTESGLRSVADQLSEGGVFALWSDDAADDAFTSRLRSVFAQAEARNVEFPNPLTHGLARNSVYIARR